MRLMSSSARLNYSDWFRRLIVMPNKPPYLVKAIDLVPVSWLVNSEFVKKEKITRSQSGQPLQSGGVMYGAQGQADSTSEYLNPNDTPVRAP